MIDQLDSLASCTAPFWPYCRNMVKPTSSEPKGDNTRKDQESVEKKKTVPGLGALDEDDEFEEFETEGQ